MSKQNLVSATISAPDKTAVLEAISTIKTTLPFLLKLSTVQKKGLRKMGDKSVNYVKKCNIGATQFGQLMPASMNVAEFTKDVLLTSDMYDIYIALSEVYEGVNNTLIAAGSDAMKTADDVYKYLKVGEKDDANVKTLLDEISNRFAGQGKKKTLKSN